MQKHVKKGQDYCCSSIPVSFTHFHLPIPVPRIATDLKLLFSKQVLYKIFSTLCSHGISHDAKRFLWSIQVWPILNHHHATLCSFLWNFIINICIRIKLYLALYNERHCIAQHFARLKWHLMTPPPPTAICFRSQSNTMIYNLSNLHV